MEVKSFKPTVGRSVPRHARKVIRDLNARKTKELGWNQYVVPISKLNERVHSSQRVPFERI